MKEVKKLIGVTHISFLKQIPKLVIYMRKDYIRLKNYYFSLIL